MDLIRFRSHWDAVSFLAVRRARCRLHVYVDVGHRTLRQQVPGYRESHAVAIHCTGGSGSVRISTARECGWTLGAQSSWVSVNGSNAGNGDALLSYSIASNPAPAARSAELVVETQRLPVTQAAAACTFSFSRSGDGIAAEGGTLDVQLTTLRGCSWNATVDAAWLSLPGARSGSASGTIRIAVAANTGAIALRYAQRRRPDIRRVAGRCRGGCTGTIADSSSGPRTVAHTFTGSCAVTAADTGPDPGSRPNLFTGTVSGVSGSCPNVSFMAGGHGVVASRSTNYSHGKCGELSNGDTVTVNGILQIDGSVTAGDIEFIKNGK